MRFGCSPTCCQTRSSFTAAGHVEVSTAIEGGTFEVAVKDTGLGITHDQLPKVFDRFHGTTRRWPAHR
ncbi:MAG: ATP-binding protein [Acidimicrobiia bacterium]